MSRSRSGRQPGAATNQLASVQGQLTDEQWNDVITPGTELYNHWCAQVDVIAGFLKQLQAAHIPVLWRPYHEMNGNWFWWGGRGGDRGTAALYRQLFDRLVNYHHLNNLVWIWSVDRPGTNAGPFADFFPGKTYFDIAALDVYRNDFQKSYYDDLLKLAAGKPVTLAEVGPAPTPAVLKQQPKWTWWMLWAVWAEGMTGDQRTADANPGQRSPLVKSGTTRNTSRASPRSAPRPAWRHCHCHPHPGPRKIDLRGPGCQTARQNCRAVPDEIALVRRKTFPIHSGLKLHHSLILSRVVCDAPWVHGTALYERRFYCLSASRARLQCSFKLQEVLCSFHCTSI